MRKFFAAIAAVFGFITGMFFISLYIGFWGFVFYAVVHFVCKYW